MWQTTVTNQTDPRTLSTGVLVVVPRMMQWFTMDRSIDQAGDDVANQGTNNAPTASPTPCCR